MTEKLKKNKNKKTILLSLEELGPMTGNRHLAKFDKAGKMITIKITRIIVDSYICVKSTL